MSKRDRIPVFAELLFYYGDEHRSKYMASQKVLSAMELKTEEGQGVLEGVGTDT